MRRRWILAGGLFAALASAEAWWFLGAPKDAAFAYPFDFGSVMRIAFYEAVQKPDVAKRIGYTEAARAKDAAAMERMNAPYELVNRKAKRMRAAGVSDEAVFRYYEKATAPLRERSLEQWKSIPTLTLKQEDALVRLVARRTGVWCLSAPEAARRVGLTKAQSKAIDAARISLLRQMKLEDRASQHDRMVLEGAPARAVAAVDKMHEIGDRLYFENRSASTGKETELMDELERQSTRPMPWVGQRWLAAHREMLEIRRKADLRRDAEAKILDLLSPEQRSRWDALVQSD